MKTSIEESMRSKIQNNLQPIYFAIDNESHLHAHHHAMLTVADKAETHFNLLIVAKAFEGLSRVDRQRMVSALFDEERLLGLHALSMKTLTESEWQKSKSSSKVT